MGAIHMPTRIMTAGSVDDGKSTLIGRLLYDLELIDDDVLADLRSASLRRGRGELDLSLFTDGLSDEREQGITIDVAFRYFRYQQRAFILADSPGHVQHTRNMACAASLADCAIILVDALTGPTEQTTRHTRIARLMGVRSLIFAINKIDLIGYSQAVFEQRCVQLRAHPGLQGADLVIPISALLGDNVVKRSVQCAWYDGPTLIEALAAQPEHSGFDASAALRFPVQGITRPTGHAGAGALHDFRGIAGRIDCGRMAVGDRLRIAGTRQSASIKNIHTFDAKRETASAGQAVHIELNEDIDISRGDTLIKADDTAAELRCELSLDLCWMSEQQLLPKRRLLFKQGTRTTAGYLEAGDQQIQLNSLSRVRLNTAQGLLHDDYGAFRRTGALIVIDPQSFDTLGAGMIRATSV
jgi:sulfate adenylyltransferase subunit 1